MREDQKKRAYPAYEKIPGGWWVPCLPPSSPPHPHPEPLACLACVTARTNKELRQIGELDTFPNNYFLSAPIQGIYHQLILCLVGVGGGVQVCMHMHMCVTHRQPSLPTKSQVLQKTVTVDTESTVFDMPLMVLQKLIISYTFEELNIPKLSFNEVKYNVLRPFPFFFLDII